MTPAPSNQSPVTSGHVVAYAVVAVVGAMLAALDAGISKGAIPLPQSLTPFLPVIVAGLTILTALLPKVTDGVPTPGMTQDARPAPVSPPAPPTPSGTWQFSRMPVAPANAPPPVAPEPAPQSPPPVPVAPETPPA